jgi:hypothetical protein
MTLRQSKNPPNGKVQTHREQSQEHAHHFDIKEFIVAGQTVNFAYYCNVLQQLHENVRRLRLKLL